MPDRKPPATDREAVEAAVRECYSTWNAHYYDDYYQCAGAYPPVHTDIVRGLLRADGARTALDAGCGPASMLRDLAEPGLERWGLDLTPEMVVEARLASVLQEGRENANIDAGFRIHLENVG